MELLPSFMFALIVPWTGVLLYSFRSPELITITRPFLLVWICFVLVVGAVVFYFLAS